VALFSIRAMTSRDADVIASWRYPPPYSFYDADRDPADLAELLDPAQWGRDYFAADDADGRLAGFFTLELAAGDAEVGLGLRPALTGAGSGQAFMDAGLRFAEDSLGATSFVLAVAAFNRRAIAVYVRAGFQQVERYEHATNGGVHQFIGMRRPGRLTTVTGRIDNLRRGVGSGRPFTGTRASLSRYPWRSCPCSCASHTRAIADRLEP
jgi:ribosomal-protein-alanine N-acetyltransferase